MGKSEKQMDKEQGRNQRIIDPQKAGTLYQ